MDEFTINEMKEMQLILQEKYKDKWEGNRHRKKAWGF